MSILGVPTLSTLPFKYLIWRHLHLKQHRDRVQSPAIYSPIAVKWRMPTMNNSEIARLQKYLQQKFGNNLFTLAKRKEAEDSVEVMLSGEFIGVIYRDEEDGDVSYDFNMAILEMDLPPAA